MPVTQIQFLDDVKHHDMAVIKDDGVYRHLRFQKPENSWHYRFEIITWPGALCLRGDVGTYVFSRVTDMFQFFRSSRTADDGLYINDGYWSEKLIASDCNGRRGDGVMRFDPDLFASEVKRRYVDHVRHHMSGMPDERKELRAALEEEVLSQTDEGETEAMRAACSFEHNGFALRDFWEVECRDYTTQFIWALYAIAWGIRTYDGSKSSQATEAA